MEYNERDITPQEVRENLLGVISSVKEVMEDLSGCCCQSSRSSIQYGGRMLQLCECVTEGAPNPTMQRRKFLVGAGSLAVGSTAAIGTGAFSLQATGGSSIDVVGESSALLGVVPNTDSEYIDDTDPVTIDLATDTGNGGTGITEMSNVIIQPAFTLTNNADEKLYVEINNPFSNNNITTSGSGSAPKGIDVQFLATPSTPVRDSTRYLGLIGRNSLPVNSGLGAEFNDPGSNVAFFLQGPNHDLGNRSSLTTGSKGKAGYLEIDPGQSFDVVYHVAVRRPGEGTSLDTSFEIEVHNDSSLMSKDDSVDGFIEP